jgi:hypothetical protein
MHDAPAVDVQQIVHGLEKAGVTPDDMTFTAYALTVSDHIDDYLQCSFSHPGFELPDGGPHDALRAAVYDAWKLVFVRDVMLLTWLAIERRPT